MIHRFLITAQAGLSKKSKETSVIGNDIQIFDNCVDRSYKAGRKALAIGYINTFQKIRP